MQIEVLTRDCYVTNVDDGYKPCIVELYRIHSCALQYRK